jgi:hypothetical protein
MMKTFALAASIMVPASISIQPTATDSHRHHGGTKAND